MDSTLRFAVGLACLVTVQVLLGGSAVYASRRRRQLEPIWTWKYSLAAFAALSILVSIIALIPGIGRYLALVVSLIGIKRMSGLDLVSTLILSFCLGLVGFATAVALSTLFDVDFLTFRVDP